MKKTLTFQIDESLWLELKSIAYQRTIKAGKNVSIASLITKAVVKWIAEEEK